MAERKSANYLFYAVSARFNLTVRLWSYAVNLSQNIASRVSVSYTFVWDEVWDRAVGKLTAKTAKGNLKPGMHNDGGGLYLRVAKTGGRSWILRCRVHGIKTDIGLGGLATMSLAEARKTAAEYRAIARAGGDPLAARRRERGIPTFEEAARIVWAEQIVTTARNEKHRAQWLNTLRDYAFPVIGSRRVDAIHSGDILRVLQPIWLTKPETARRVRQRLRTVLDWSIAARHREHSNPLAGIERALPKQGDRPQHHSAVPYTDLPALMRRLAESDGVAALAVRFAVLTAARSGEVRGARWAEIDRDSAVWTVPADRMKAKTEHRVPLSPEAIAVLDRAAVFSRDLIFPGRGNRRPLSDMSLMAALRRLRPGVTVHGMRSTFRDWAAERTSIPREIAEMCLAHLVGSAVERAYRRTDLFDKRRALIDQWGRFCCPQSADIIEIGARQ